MFIEVECSYVLLTWIAETETSAVPLSISNVTPLICNSASGAQNAGIRDKHVVHLLKIQAKRIATLIVPKHLYLKYVLVILFLLLDTLDAGTPLLNVWLVAQSTTIVLIVLVQTYTHKYFQFDISLLHSHTRMTLIKLLQSLRPEEDLETLEILLGFAEFI